MHIRQDGAREKCAQLQIGCAGDGRQHAVGGMGGVFVCVRNFHYKTATNSGK